MAAGFPLLAQRASRQPGFSATRHSLAGATGFSAIGHAALPGSPKRELSGMRVAAQTWLAVSLASATGLSATGIPSLALRASRHTIAGSRSDACEHFHGFASRVQLSSKRYHGLWFIPVSGSADEVAEFTEMTRHRHKRIFLPLVFKRHVALVPRVAQHVHDAGSIGRLAGAARCS